MRRIPALLLCIAPFSAYAADSSPLASPRASQRAPDAAEQELGIGLVIGPGYLGGNKTVFRAGPFGEANFKNGIFLSTSDGLGFRFPIAGSDFSIAASLGPSASRRERDGEDGDRNRLKGMGDVSTRAQANFFVNYDAGPFHAATELHQTIGARHGTSVDFTGSYDVLASGKDLLQVSAGFTYANRDLMQTYFGVTAEQSANSGNAVYMPKAGVAGSGLGITWRHAFSHEWIGTLGAGVVALRGPAGDSPLTERRNSGAIGASVGYRF